MLAIELRLLRTGIGHSALVHSAHGRLHPVLLPLR
jgi:hypothetical protein